MEGQRHKIKNTPLLALPEVQRCRAAPAPIQPCQFRCHTALYRGEPGYYGPVRIGFLPIIIVLMNMELRKCMLFREFINEFHNGTEIQGYNSV